MMRVSILVVAGNYCHVGLYEKVAFKSTPAEPLPRWAIGTGQSSCLQFRSGTIARRGRGGIMPFTIFNICCVRQDMPVILKVQREGTGEENKKRLSFARIIWIRFQESRHR